MRLYSGMTTQFIQDATQNNIADKMKESFFDYFRFYPTDNEIRSWKNSLRAVKDVFQDANLIDHGIILEYQLPLTSKRLDCLICGKNENNKDNAVIIELKQWDSCEKADGEHVLTWVGGGNREVLHPSVQVGQYQMYLQDTHTAFYEGSDPIFLNSCAYLHNYCLYPEDALLDEKFNEYLKKYPVFSSKDFSEIKDFLRSNLKNGQGKEVLDRVEKSKYKPSKKLMEHIGNVIKGKSEYILLDEQLIVYDRVLACAKDALNTNQKSSILIKGGPGTGKSVIAINLMADLLLQNYNSHYATGSKAFTETLRKVIGRRGGVQFKYFNSYTEAENNEIDVLICDEAHRIRESSNNMYTPSAKRSNKKQLEELISASKVSVFFIDDNQVVRPNEIGSSELIRDYARKENCKIFEYELEAQFRCNGSDAFINWVNNTLMIKRTANVIWDQNEEFEFKIFDSPESLYNAVKQKNLEKNNSARLVASYCWPWSNPRPDGTLIDDVVIGSFKMPWEKKTKFWEWATEVSGMEQVGTVYTAQGFEFDYVGVIFSNDLKYCFDKQAWESHSENSYDTAVKRSKVQFLELIKNTYRVLLTRGMKGCYVYFMDKDSENFFKSRIE